MILKTIKKEQDQFTIQHIDNIKSIVHERVNNIGNEYLVITYYDGSEQLFTLSELAEKESVYQDLFSNVFLLNDEGKTIERIM